MQGPYVSQTLVNFSAQETGDTCTMNCRFNHSIVSLHLCKEYLTAIKLKTLLTQDKVLNLSLIHI